MAKNPRCLPSSLDPKIRPAEKVCTTTSKDKVLSKQPPTEERSQPTKVQHKFTFPPHLDPSFVRLSKKSKPVSANANMDKRSQTIEVSQILTQPSLCEPSSELHATEAQDLNPHLQDNVAESDGSDSEPLQQENEEDTVRKSKSSYALSMKSRNVVPNWPDSLDIDDKDDVLTIGGNVLIKYLGSLAKIEKFCPIGEVSWHNVNKVYKADVVNRVRDKFVIPNEHGEIFDGAILKRVAKFWRNYKHSLKKSKFHPDKRTKEQIINDVPPGHTRDNWMRLVEYWYSTKGQKLSSGGEKARASQSHVHTTGCISYANKRADFVESNGKQPSHLEFFELTHTKIGGGFVENTLSSQFLEEANSKVDELLLTSSSSKSRAEIENDVFHKLMYENDNPKRPLGFGFGVKQSQVFGVHGILRKRGYVSATNNSAEMEIMKAKMLDMEKEN